MYVICSALAMQLSYAFSELDTARMFRPSHFRLIPSELHLASGIAAVITEYHWERMVLITQPLPVFQSVSVLCVTASENVMWRTRRSPREPVIC